MARVYLENVPSGQLMFRPRSEPDTCSLTVTSIPPLRVHAWCICAVQSISIPPLRFRAWCIRGLQALSRLQTIDSSHLIRLLLSVMSISYSESVIRDSM